MENSFILTLFLSIFVLFYFPKIILSEQISRAKFRTSSITNEKDVRRLEGQWNPKFIFATISKSSPIETSIDPSYFDTKLETLRRLRSRLKQEKLDSSFADDYIKKLAFIENAQGNEIMLQLSNKYENDIFERNPIPSQMEIKTNNTTTKEKTTDHHYMNYNSWFHLRTILENMKSIIYNQYVSTSSDKKSLEINVIDNIIKVGNSFNFLYQILNNVNDNLVIFLNSKYEELKLSLLSHYPILKILLKIDKNNMNQYVIKPLLKIVAEKYGNKNLKHFQDLDFVAEMMVTSGFAPFEVDQVFDILGLVRSKNFTSDYRGYGYNIEKSGGYGHGGGGGGGGYGHMSHHGGYGGYGGMSYLDPFVMLAGLAFASFLAYLLYTLLSTTTAAAPAPAPRLLDTSSFNLDLSDTPSIMTNLYTHLDQAERDYNNSTHSDYHKLALYREYTSDNEENLEGEISYLLNNLWSNFEKDKNELSCLKQFLCDNIRHNYVNAFSLKFSLEQIALSSLSEMLGFKRVGQEVDRNLQELLTKGHLDCQTHRTCL